MTLVESLQLITSTLWRTKTQDDRLGILEDILTPAEITEIALRIQILKLLKSGMSQREIAETLQISITTVSRGSRLLQYDTKSIHQFLD